MATLEENLVYAMDSRVKELATLRNLSSKSFLSGQLQELLRRTLIPTIYSFWEGFIKESFNLYVDELNKLKFTRREICFNLLVHSIDHSTRIKFKFKDSIVEYTSQIEYIKNLCLHLDNPILLTKSIPTDSNVNFAVLDKILNRFNLQEIPEIPYKSQLDRLLMLRNNIAHGENSIPISQPEIDDMSTLIQNLMVEVSLRILEGFNSKTYLENPTSP